MKKLYILLVIGLIGFVGNAQIVNIPDANFKAKLLSASSANQVASTQTPDANGAVTTFTAIDTNNDGEIQVSEALAIKWLKVSISSIADFTGIQSFPNLIYLSCRDNSLTTLNISNLVSLQFLYCYNNQLTSLDTSNSPGLKTFYCYGNSISTLNITSCLSLTTFVCNSNQLTTLDVSNRPNLTTLYCYGNQITSLNTSNCPNLTKLYCYENSISTLNITSCLNLTDLQCYTNQITTLDVSNRPNLTSLKCYDNQLTSLNTSNCTALSDITCNNNSLTSLDVSTNLSAANSQLNAANNLLTTITLPPSFNQTTYVNLSANLFESLAFTSGSINVFFLMSMPNLKHLSIKNIILSGIGGDSFLVDSCPNLEYICCSDDRVQGIQAYVDSLNYNCTVNSYCSFVPAGVSYTIQGYAKYDLDNNGCSASDGNIPYLKTAITNGTYSGTFYSNATGNYSIPVTAGTIILTPLLENPTYFNISPSTASISFPSQSSPYTQNFCATKNGTHNDLEVTLFPLTATIPSLTFNSIYKIIYKNKGTQIQSGTVNFVFDDSKIDYTYATPSVTTIVTNNLSWSFSNLLPFETREIMVVLNVNAPTETPAVNAGDVLSYTATITGATDETPNDNTSTLNQTAVNSFDPNDKTCLEGTTVSPSMVGNYVHYVVRFENDGTANAQNIVVKDMIDTTKFDVSTLIPLSGSASYTTRISNTNQVEFIFQNINLPYAAGTNTGYVAFKIKTKPTLVVGDTFSNSASIFFDYNAPIVTNTYTTTIAALATQDFDFGNYFSVYPNPAKQVLNMETKAEIGVKSINIYNILGQMVIAIPNAESVSTIDVSYLKIGTYFIKVNTDKGTANATFIKE